MIQLERISKIYGELPKQAIALKNVDLKIGKAEFIVVRGPSGSGKTTLLMSIGGMLQPSSGTVRINDKDIYLLSNVERSRFRALNIGFVFQMFHLIPYLSVLENITLSTRFIKYDKTNKIRHLATTLYWVWILCIFDKKHENPHRHFFSLGKR